MCQTVDRNSTFNYDILLKPPIDLYVLFSYVGPELDLEFDGNYISRLESQLLHSVEDTAELDEEEQGILVAGGLAREVLSE